MLHHTFWKVLILIRQYIRKNTQTPQKELVLEVIQVTLAYFIPTLAMIICYSLIIRTLLCARSLQKNKPIKIFSVLVLVILTQIPYTFFRLIKVIDWSFKSNSSFEKAIIVTKALAYFYGYLNPLFLHGNENQEVLTQNY